ncbi:MAG TPA: hypothetical protein VF614_01460 [Chthoniobacteraceae bacterium]|jgi:hypothetical protein
MKRILLLCSLAAATLFASEQPISTPVTERTAFTFYPTFKRLTDEPHHVAPLTAMLCTFPAPELIEREKAQTGPHYDARVHIYANPLAAEAVVRKQDAFPVGAVIVKEKLAPKHPEYGWSNGSLQSRLPRWMLVRNNREAVLQGVEKLLKTKFTEWPNKTSSQRLRVSRRLLPTTFARAAVAPRSAVAHLSGVRHRCVFRV